MGGVTFIRLVMSINKRCIEEKRSKKYLTASGSFSCYGEGMGERREPLPVWEDLHELEV